MWPEATINGYTLPSLAHYTLPDLIVPQLRERDTAGIIGELSHVLQRQGSVSDVLPFYHAALNRELLSNSALETGLAFPHARLRGIKQLQFAFGRTSQPVVWGSKGSWSVQFIFLLAVPATDAAGSLHLLAGLARLGQQSEQLTQLRSATSPEAILAVLEQVRMRKE